MLEKMQNKQKKEAGVDPFKIYLTQWVAELFSESLDPGAKAIYGGEKPRKSPSWVVE